jgi:hypothetical protein
MLSKLLRHINPRRAGDLLGSGTNGRLDIRSGTSRQEALDERRI